MALLDRVTDRPIDDYLVEIERCVEQNEGKRLEHELELWLRSPPELCPRRSEVIGKIRNALERVGG